MANLVVKLGIVDLSVSRSVELAPKLSELGTGKIDAHILKAVAKLAADWK